MEGREGEREENGEERERNVAPKTNTKNTRLLLIELYTMCGNVCGCCGVFFFFFFLAGD
jgi:hypothetical protein